MLEWFLILILVIVLIYWFEKPNAVMHSVFDFDNHLTFITHFTLFVLFIGFIGYFITAFFYLRFYIFRFQQKIKPIKVKDNINLFQSLFNKHEVELKKIDENLKKQKINVTDFQN
jgi:hypothetical protein